MLAHFQTEKNNETLGTLGDYIILSKTIHHTLVAEYIERRPLKCQCLHVKTSFAGKSH